MSKIEIVKAKHPNGELSEYYLKVSQNSPWTIEYQRLDGTTHQCEGTDLFEALREMRKYLESLGVQLFCAGARPDVSPSGMSRSMGGGRKAYIVHIGRPANRNEMVDIFDYAEPGVVGTIQQQRDYFQAWKESLNSLMKPLPGEIQEAKLHPNGWVYRIAGQFGPNDGVPPEAIVGAWKVNAQGDVVGEFIRNEKYNPARFPSRSHVHAPSKADGQ